MIRIGCGHLGSGSLIPGINGFVAMLSSLAALAPPGSGLSRRHLSENNDERIEVLPIGQNLLMGGSHSRSLFHDFVVPPLVEAQNHYGLKVLDQSIKKGNALPPTRKFDTEPTGLNPYLTERSDLELVHQGAEGQKKDPQILIQGSKSLHGGAGSARPHIFIAGRDPKTLNHLLPYVHGGKPLAYIPLSSGEDVERLADFVGKIRDGFTIASGIPLTIRGQVIATAAPDLLPTLVSVGAMQLPWTRDFLWLVDTPVPGWSELPPSTACDLHPRYVTAMQRIVAERLGSPRPKSYPLESISEGESLVVTALTQLEAVQAGVTGSFRQLLSTLAFGCLVMAEAFAGNVAEWRAVFSALPNLAIWLARRSVAAIQATCGREDQIQLMELARSLVYKLSVNPGSIRDLQRRFHSLSASRCQAAVVYLREAGVVTSQDKCWTLAMPCDEALNILSAR